MKAICLALLTVCCSVAATAQKVNRPVTKPVAKSSKPVATTRTVTRSFSNGITMNITGFSVAEAGLFFEDGTKVPENNMVELNEKVVLYAVIDSGYKVVNGKVFPGGSERITLSNGFEVLKSGDVFAAYNAGVTPEDGRYISLKAMITQIDDKRLDVNVSFKFWDKKSNSNITGSYKMHIK